MDNNTTMPPATPHVSAPSIKHRVANSRGRVDIHGEDLGNPILQMACQRCAMAFPEPM